MTKTPSYVLLLLRRMFAVTTLFIVAFVSVNYPSQSYSANYKPIDLDSDYQHDRFNTQPKDIIRYFRAYTTSFDSEIAGNGNGAADFKRVPKFVTYEIKKYPEALGKGPKRPSTWITDKDLYRQGLVSSDSSYKYSSAFRSRHKNWYDRGHLCAKFIAWRLGRNADWNTHTMLNAVPQRHTFNAGIWLDLEKKTANWADKYEQIWVITGPVFNNNIVSKWIGEPIKGELPVAVPNGLFKIVIKESAIDGQIDVLSFYYPQLGRSYRKKPFNHEKYMVSIDWIEKRTQLDFLTDLDDQYENRIERIKTREMWE